MHGSILRDKLGACPIGMCPYQMVQLVKIQIIPVQVPLEKMEAQRLCLIIQFTTKIEWAEENSFGEVGSFCDC